MKQLKQSNSSKSKNVMQKSTHKKGTTQIILYNHKNVFFRRSSVCSISPTYQVESSWLTISCMCTLLWKINNKKIRKHARRGKSNKILYNLYLKLKLFCTLWRSVVCVHKHTSQLVHEIRVWMDTNNTVCAVTSEYIINFTTCYMWIHHDRIILHAEYCERDTDAAADANAAVTAG